jgi:alkaline phosphatase
MFRKLRFAILIIVIISLGQLSQAAVKNVVLMIGDGMGFEQVKAASMYAYGDEKKLPFEKYYRGEVTTHSANSYTHNLHATDSAAAATAMATGQKVNDDVVSQRAGKPIETILEISKKMGKATGLVTTKYLTDATPAGFGAHTRRDNNHGDIANDYLNQTRPNILFGAYLANGKGMTADKAEKAGYTIVKTREQMKHIAEAVEKNSVEEVFIAGLFSPDVMPWEYNFYYPDKNPLSQLFKRSKPSYDTIPHLSEMTKAALNILDNDPNGFFLMAEGARIDTAGHDNLIEFNVFETLEFTNAFQVVLDWAENRDDTLIIVTADHECGGLLVKKNRGKGFMPEVSWRWGSHTGANVPIYVVGEGAKEFAGVIDNTQIFTIIMKLICRQNIEQVTYSQN